MLCGSPILGGSPRQRKIEATIEDLQTELMTSLKQMLQESFRDLGERLIRDVRQAWADKSPRIDSRAHVSSSTDPGGYINVSQSPKPQALMRSYDTEVSSESSKPVSENMRLVDSADYSTLTSTLNASMMQSLKRFRLHGEVRHRKKKSRAKRGTRAIKRPSRAISNNSGSDGELPKEVWIQEAGLPYDEGKPALMDTSGITSVAAMRRRCETMDDCVGFSYWPERGWWFPKRKNSGFDASRAIYSQKYPGETWEWHYMRNRTTLVAELADGSPRVTNANRVSEKARGSSPRVGFDDIQHAAEAEHLLASKSHEVDGKRVHFDIQEMSTVFRARVRDVVEKQAFEHAIGVVVVLNALTLGVETDYQSYGGAHPWLTGILSGSEAMFCMLFMGELLIRIYIYRLDFFFMDTAWNIFDLTVVSLQVIEQLVRLLEYMNVELNMDILRMVRILRLVRIARLVRLVRLVEELGTITSSILASLEGLFWTLLLLVMLMYIVSVFFTQIVAEIPPSSRDEAITYWYGRLPRSILTMYEVVVGGVSWDEVVTPLIQDISPSMGVVLSLYVAFCVFALLNMATGVFVDRAMRKAQEDTDTSTANRISDVFFSDQSSSSSISLEEFKEKIHKQEMQDYFKSISVDPSEAETLFALLDADGSGFVDADELVSGCLRLRGNAKALDLQVLFYGINLVNERLLETQMHLVDSLHAMNNRLSERREKKSSDQISQIQSGRSAVSGSHTVSFQEGDVLTGYTESFGETNVITQSC